MCITLYTSPGCGYCRKAKSLLESRALPYRAVDLGMDDAGREVLARRTGRMTFPQVLVDGHPLGGYRELEQFVKQAGLSPCG